MTFTFLWFLLAAAALESSAAVSPHPPALHAVIGDASGTWVAAALPLPDAVRSRAKTVWVWMDGVSPRRYDVAAMPREEAALVSDLLKNRGRVIQTRVRGWSRPDDLAGMRALVAPEEMWLTVPEELLPSYPLTTQGVASLPILGRNRVRILGKGLGSSWIRAVSPADVAEVMLRRTTDAELSLRFGEGLPVARAFATAMIASRGAARLEQQAQFVSDRHGRIRISSLPEADVLTLVVTAEGAAPRTVSGTPAELTRALTLSAAGEIAGRFVDERGSELAGVRLEAEAWIAQTVPAIAAASGVSDDRGRWVLRGLPRNRVVVRAITEGRGTFQKELSLEEGDVDLGTIALHPSHDLKLRVVDGDGAPIGDARVKTNHGFAGVTAEDGSVRVTGISQTEPVVLTVAAPRFAKLTQTLSAPFSEETEIVLARAFTIEGRVVDEQSAPVSDAVIVVMTGSRYQRLESGPDGEFSLDLDAGTELELRFESPTSGFHATTQAEGREGEVRDLGSIRLDAGGIVRGRIVSAGGIPVSRARIWAIRPGAAGAVASWLAGRVVQAASDDEGEFELRGLPVGPSVLRVDATDFARAYRDVVVGSEPVSIGAIEIDRGSVVTVSANGGEGVARIDLRGEWVDADMITAPVVDGEARLRNVPRGQHRVTVLQGRAVTCERQVSVTSGEEAAVRCPAPMIVTGRVLLGGSPATGGSISWRQIAGTDSLIDTTISPMGARQERVYGLGFGTITVPVREDGSYETRELRAGEWQVSWRSGDGVVTPDRAVNVPDQPMASVGIEFAGSVIRGSVVDASGKPVQGARIREIQGPLFAMTTSEGTFTISGVLAGSHRLQASLGMKSSPIHEIRIEDGKQAPNVALVLEDKRRNELAITVTGVNGEPRPHALVFVEAAGVLRTLTADAAGIAVGAFPEGLPDGSRMVAFAANDWAFGRLRRTGGDDDRQTATIRFGATGRLRIRSSTKSGVPEIRSNEGGDLAWILARAGFHHFLTPQSPIEIQGLPPGAYEVSIDSSRAVAMVHAGRDVSADLY